MEDEWFTPKKSAEISLPRKLEPLSIGDLKEYLTLLAAEKVRTEEEIQKKQGMMSAAESLFKKED